jgi:hypothetical protein
MYLPFKTKAQTPDGAFFHEGYMMYLPFKIKAQTPPLGSFNTSIADVSTFQNKGSNTNWQIMVLCFGMYLPFKIKAQTP